MRLTLDLTPTNVVRLIGVTTLLAVAGLAATWLLGEPPATRAQLVSELSLLTSGVGFPAAVLALLATGQQLARSIEGPRLHLEWGSGAIQLRLSGEGGIPPGSGSIGQTMFLENRSRSRLEVLSLTARSLITVKTTTYLGSEPFQIFAESFSNDRRVRVAVYPDTTDLWALQWEAKEPGIFRLSEPFALEPGEKTTLPTLFLSVTAVDEARELLNENPAMWRLDLFVHTSRGTQGLERLITVEMQGSGDSR